MAESREQPGQSTNGSPHSQAYHLENGAFVREHVAVHDTEQYDVHGYRMLSNTQRLHFWNRGRRQFREESLRLHLAPGRRSRARVIDLGAGCGGWVAHLSEAGTFPDGELAAADSSLVALQATRELVRGQQLRIAAQRASLVAVGTRYFMFLLSPLLLASRLLNRPSLLGVFRRPS